MINIKALLCFHGLLSSEIDFTYIKGFLLNKYDYIHIPNMPGHGNNNLPFTKENTLSYVIVEYDKLRLKYNEIDVIGYSLGGVLACYLAQYRIINKLILLSPAFNYFNFKAYNPKMIKKSNIKIKQALKLKRIKYFYTFTRIVSEVEAIINNIYPPVCIIWGEDDVLVSEGGCFTIYKRAINSNKFYITIKNVNHSTILYSSKVVELILKFIE